MMSDQHQYKDTIEVVFVHTDFTSSWPVRPNHPEGWPGAATSRHVASVHDDQTRVVFVVARDPNTRTTIRSLILSIYFHLGFVRRHRDKVTLFGRRLVLIRNETVRRVFAAEEFELAEEVSIGKVVILQSVLSPASGAHQGKLGKERRKIHGWK